MAPGEIHLSYFPFGGTPGMKLRPVLVLTGALGTVPEVIVAYISSVIPAQSMPSDVILDPLNPTHAGTNLKTISALRLHKLATIHQRNIVRYLGKLSSSTATEVENKLRALFNL